MTLFVLFGICVVLALAAFEFADWFVEFFFGL